MATFKENPPKIYLKQSDKVWLADCRARIVKEEFPNSPEENQDLVFELVEDRHDIPQNAIYKWYFSATGNWFFTTADRCKKMISENPSDWTQEKLKKFYELEANTWRNWWGGMVYGFIIEKWDEKLRKWVQISSRWGMYGNEELMENLAEETDGDSIPICIDSEDMKYDFDNTEKKYNEFK